MEMRVQVKKEIKDYQIELERVKKALADVVKEVDSLVAIAREAKLVSELSVQTIKFLVSQQAKKENIKTQYLEAEEFARGTIVAVTDEGCSTLQLAIQEFNLDSAIGIIVEVGAGLKVAYRILWYPINADCTLSDDFVVSPWTHSQYIKRIHAPFAESMALVKAYLANHKEGDIY